LNEDDGPRQENMTAHMVRKVDQLLRQHSPINLFEFVINPKCFGQTIENIFFLSFAIRDARAKIEIDQRGIPIVTSVRDLGDEEQEIEHKQCILEMTMAQYNVFSVLEWD
jgi:non-structural maintenance of chromosomes element 4